MDTRETEATSGAVISKETTDERDGKSARADRIGPARVA